MPDRTAHGLVLVLAILCVDLPKEPSRTEQKVQTFGSSNIKRGSHGMSDRWTEL
jgi:hypothetical protein